MNTPHRLVVVVVVLACACGPQAAPVPSVSSRQHVGVTGDARVSTATGGDVTQSVATEQTVVPYGGVVKEEGYGRRPRKTSVRPTGAKKGGGYDPRQRRRSKQRSKSQKGQKGRKSPNFSKGPKYTPPTPKEPYYPASKEPYHPAPKPQSAHHPQRSPKGSYVSSNVPRSSQAGYTPQNVSPRVASRQGVDVTGNAQVSTASVGTVSQTVATKRTVKPLDSVAKGVYGASSGDAPSGGQDSAPKESQDPEPTPKGSYYPQSTTNVPDPQKPTPKGSYHPEPRTERPYHPKTAPKTPYYPKPTPKGPYYPKPTPKGPYYQKTTTKAPYYLKPTPKGPYNQKTTPKAPYYPKPSPKAPYYPKPSPKAPYYPKPTPKAPYYPETKTKAPYYPKPTTERPYYSPIVPRGSVYTPQNASPPITSTQDVNVAGNAQVSATTGGTVSQTVASKHTVFPLGSASNGVYGANAGREPYGEGKRNTVTRGVDNEDVGRTAKRSVVGSAVASKTGSGVDGAILTQKTGMVSFGVPVPKFTLVPGPGVTGAIVAETQSAGKNHLLATANRVYSNAAAPPPLHTVVQQARKHSGKVRNAISQIAHARRAASLPKLSPKPYPSQKAWNGDPQQTPKGPYSPNRTAKSPYSPNPTTKTPYYPKPTTKAPYYAKTTPKGSYLPKPTPRGSYYPKPGPVPKRKTITVAVKEEGATSNEVIKKANGMEHRFQAAKRQLARFENTKACSGAYC